MINFNPNNVLKIEILTKDNFKSGDIDILFYQDNSAYGFDNFLIGNVEIDLDNKCYSCVPDEFFEEEDFYQIANNIILNKVRDLSHKYTMEFGKIKEDTGEILKRFTLDNGIEHTLKSEVVLLNEYEKDLIGYHLGYKPEEEFFE